MPRTIQTGASPGDHDVVTLAAHLSDEELHRYLAGIRQLMASESAPSQRVQRRRKAATYRLRVDLADAKPPIWRRLLVPSTTSLSDLHRVIYTAMGWSGGHLHQFVKGATRNDPNAERYVARDEFVAPGAIHESEVRLDELLTTKGDKLFYEYDLSDGWLHSIRLEGVEPLARDELKFRCVAGRRACPPEGCGGMDAYQELVALTRMPYDELGIEQLGRLRCHTPHEGWRPDEFDLSAANEALAEQAA